MDRFKTRELRHQYTVAQASFLSLIALYARAKPSHIQLHSDGWHKPFLRNAESCSDLQFSFSHCNNVALCGFAKNRSIGVDVEEADAGADWEHLADLCLSEYEKKWFLCLPDHQRAAVFVELWTIKEAYLKAIGTGLAVPPSEVEVECDTHNQYQLRSSQGGQYGRGDWNIFAFSPAPGFTAAAVIQGQPCRLRSFSWTPQLLD